MVATSLGSYGELDDIVVMAAESVGVGGYPGGWGDETEL